MIPLGDSHNFGKRVCLIESGLISKPRNIYWEWLILGRGSPFREAISRYATAASCPSPIAVLPQLNFTANEPNSLRGGGSVDYLRLLPPHPDVFTSATFELIGSTLALISWLGINDLHNDNIVFGTALEGSPVFGPIDIEGIFDDYYLLSQAHLMQSRELKVVDAGLLKISNFLNEFPTTNAVAALSSGYLKTLDLLIAKEDEILRDIVRIRELGNFPSRVILRPTRDYYRLLGDHESILDNRSDLLASEREQLLRGDIPYFFRTLNSRDIKYFDSESTAAKADAPQEIEDRALFHARTICGDDLGSRKNGELLRKAGILQLVRNITDTRGDFQESFGSVLLEASRENIQLTYLSQLGASLKIGCRRVNTHG